MVKYMYTIGLQIAGLYCQPFFSQFSKAKTSKGHFQSQIDHSTQGKPLKKASRRPREQNASLCSGRVTTSGGSRGGGAGGPDPPFGPRCRLFNIGPKVGPPPPFLLVDLRWTPVADPGCVCVTGVITPPPLECG